MCEQPVHDEQVYRDSLPSHRAKILSLLDAIIVASTRPPQVKLQRVRTLEIEEARAMFRSAIKRTFAKVVESNRGSLAQKAAEIGVQRQQLQQYAQGTVPGSDVLLTAFVKWGLRIRIEDKSGQNWWECGTVGNNRQGSKKVPDAIQLPLFKAIQELGEDDMELRITKKEPGRLRLAVDILFRGDIA